MNFLASCFLFMFMGIFSGYFGGRLYKTVRGQNWKSAAFWTSLLYPGVVFGTCFFLNFFIWGQKSSGAVPFTTMIAILCMWMGVSLPLVFTGYYFGYRKRLNLVDKGSCKNFSIFFYFCSQHIHILQGLTNLLLPKFSKNSIKKLVYEQNS